MSKYDPQKYQRNKHKYQTPEYKAVAKAWRDKNRERLNQYSKEWFANNKEYRQEYNEETKEHHREVCKAWYMRNRPIKQKPSVTAKEKKSERQRNGQCVNCLEKRLPNSEIYCEKHWIYQKAAQRLGKGAVDLCDALLRKLESQDRKCPYTGEDLILGINCSLDHIQPTSRFPELANDINNVEWISLNANYAKRASTKDEFVAMCKTVASRF